MDETESFLHQLYDDSEGDRVHVSHCSNHTYALPDKKDYHAESMENLLCIQEINLNRI